MAWLGTIEMPSGCQQGSLSGSEVQPERRADWRVREALRWQPSFFGLATVGCLTQTSIQDRCPLSSTPPVHSGSAEIRRNTAQVPELKNMPAKYLCRLPRRVISLQFCECRRLGAGLWTPCIHHMSTSVPGSLRQAMDSSSGRAEESWLRHRAGRISSCHSLDDAPSISGLSTAYCRSPACAGGHRSMASVFVCQTLDSLFLCCWACSGWEGFGRLGNSLQTVWREGLGRVPARPTSNLRR